MKIEIITIFPNAFSYLNESMMKIAKEKGSVEFVIHDLRKWSIDKHNKIDDKPFGGGPGMVMQIEPIYNCLKEIGAYPKLDNKTKVVLLSAKGRVWNQNYAKEYASNIERLVIICGHYEGVDERVAENLIDEEISIGKFIISGGELGAMIITDSVVRLLKGVLSSEQSLVNESYNDEDLVEIEYPHYTRPSLFKTEEGEEWGIPEVLLSGNHKLIEDWKVKNSKKI